MEVIFGVLFRPHSNFCQPGLICNKINLFQETKGTEPTFRYALKYRTDAPTVAAIHSGS
jgi:hypothetical protein